MNLATGGSSSWTIKQNGITKASGSGTTATANNISTGNFEVKFAVSFPCGLNTIYFTENNWFGPPNSSGKYLIGGYMTYPSPLPCIYKYGIYYAFHLSGPIPGTQGTNYVWSGLAAYIDYLTTYATKFVPYNPGPPYYGSGYIQVVGNNACGSSIPVQCGYGPCGGFMAAPNPADNYIDIVVNEEIISAESLNPGSEYVLRMVDKMSEVKYTAEVREFPYRINTSNLQEGLYIINLINEGKIISIQVIIEH